MLFRSADFTIIAAVIDKQRHVERYSEPGDPYEIALAFCMERLQRFLMERGQIDRMTHVQVECRGKAEDAKLELEFRRVCDGQNAVGLMPNLDLRFMDKKHKFDGATARRPGRPPDRPPRDQAGPAKPRL